VAIFRSIVLAAAIAGAVSGGATAALHIAGTSRLIAAAEVYERAAEGAPAPAMSEAGHDHATAGAMAEEGDAGAWEPADGIERALFTTLADVLTGVGFALLLAAAFALHGQAVDWRKGLYWGLAGFVAFTLAPALGLTPMVPGTAAAPLWERQLWWVVTAGATAGGLALLFLDRRALAALAGIAVILAPHLIGAPQPAEYKSAAPPDLAHRFVVAAIVTSFLSWLMLGTLTASLFQRFRRQ
jgi:cobalt transporter subunit CbtA